MRIDVDEAGFDDWIRALDQAAEDVADQGKKVVGKGSLNIKKGAQRRVSGFAHLPHYPRAISYDVTSKGTFIESEIGPDKKRPQGPLGNIVEYGTVNNAPIPHLGPELDLEEPRFASAVEDLGADLLERP